MHPHTFVHASIIFDQLLILLARTLAAVRTRTHTHIQTHTHALSLFLILNLWCNTMLDNYPNAMFG